MTLQSFHKKFIANTYFEDTIEDHEVKICNLPSKHCKLLDYKIDECIVTTRSLKHIYDKRTASEFDFILNNFSNIILNPDLIFEDSKGKSGEFYL